MPTIDDEPAAELPEVRAGRLPERYANRMQDVFVSELLPLLRPGVAILDIGAGRAPTIAPTDRPQSCTYVGLDISADELASASPGSYTASVTHDITRPLPEGATSFEIAISWQAFEHVKPLKSALDNVAQLLKPGGRLLFQVSGSHAVFALLARVIPHRLRVLALSRLLGHPPEEKFPVHYDHCFSAALERLLASWSSVRIVPFYRGATYFAMHPGLQRAYLRYEDLIARREIRDLATHYLVHARW